MTEPVTEDDYFEYEARVYALLCEALKPCLNAEIERRIQRLQGGAT